MPIKQLPKHLKGKCDAFSSLRVHMCQLKRVSHVFTCVNFKQRASTGLQALEKGEN